MVLVTVCMKVYLSDKSQNGLSDSWFKHADRSFLPLSWVVDLGGVSVSGLSVPCMYCQSYS